jgi:CrcB protein
MSSGAIQTYLVVMLGGALGSAARLALASFVALRFGDTFPLGTLLVNILGCFVIGLYGGLTSPEGAIAASPLSRQFVMIGILGGFTTFSSFGLQTYDLITHGQWFRGTLYVALSVLICLAAVWLGMGIASNLEHLKK